MAAVSSLSCRTVTAGSVAQSVLEYVTAGIRKIDHIPTLVGFLANTDTGARMYADWTGKTCANGIKFELREVDRSELQVHIQAANKDNTVDGIMIYYPVFDVEQDQKIKELVCPTKDVEGLNTGFMADLYDGPPLTTNPQQQIILPTTPMAMVEILKYLDVYDFNQSISSRLSGRSVTIINRSDVVGKPLAALLAHEGADVYSIDITGVQLFRKAQNSKRVQVEDLEIDLRACLALSDVVISGVPGDRFKVPIESLKDGCICLNFSSGKNFGTEVKSKAAVYVPSIGQATIAALMRNLLYLVDNQRYIQQQEALVVPKQRILLSNPNIVKSWLLRYFASRSIIIPETARKVPGLGYSYAICLVGLSIGLLSLLG